MEASPRTRDDPRLFQSNTIGGDYSDLAWVLHAGEVWHVDACIFPVWVLCNAILGTAAWRLARAWFPNDLPLPMVMHTLVLSWAGIVAATFVVGSAGILSGASLMVAVTILAAAVLLGLRHFQEPAAAPTQDFPAAETCWLWFWLTLTSLWIGHSITNGLLRFPTEWDTLNYHLPMIVQWLQAGSLYAPDCAQWSNPGNNEVLGLWLVAPFSGDFLIGLNNLGPTILLACAAVALGRNLGLSSALAHLAGFAVVANSVILTQLLNAANDVAVAGLFVACLAYGFRFAKSEAAPVTEGLGCSVPPSPDKGEGLGSPFLPSPHRGEGLGVRGSRHPDLLLFAVALGLLAGVKYYALGYAAVAGTTLFFLAWKRQGWRQAMGLAAMGLAGLFLWGGYWYLRNAWVTGSPLYPKTFGSQADEMANIYPDMAQTTFLGNRRPELVELSIKAVWHMTGPLHLTAFVLAPLALAWMMISAWRASRRNQTEAADYRWAFAFLIAGACSVLLVTPFAVEDDPGTLNQMYWYYCPVRYGMCFLSLTVVGLGLMLQDVFARTSVLDCVPHVLFLTGGIFQMSFPNRQLPWEKTALLIIAGNLVLLAVNGCLLAHLWPRLGKGFLTLAALALLGAGAWGIDRWAGQWHRGFATNYDKMLSHGAFTFFADNKPGEARLCALDHRAYPFFGSRRQVHVCQPTVISSPAWLRAYMFEKNAGFVAAEPHAPMTRRKLYWGMGQLLEETPHEFQAINPEGQRLMVYRMAMR